MLKHTLLLADGTLLTSGPDAGPWAIRSVTLTDQVSDATDLAPGTACAVKAEIELWAPQNALPVAQGDELTLRRQDTDTGTEETVGLFLAEEPVKTSANVCRITAYDRMTRFDRDLSDWLSQRQQDFPMSLTELVQGVCDACGVPRGTDLDGTLPNGDYPVPRFYADGLTGRQLLQWAGQIACRFARINPAGQLVFDWYRPPAAAWAVGPGSGTLRVALRLAGETLRTAGGEIWRFSNRQLPYLQGTLSYRDYVTAPLDKVQIRQSESDVGVLYPPDAAGTNTLVLQGNLLLTAESADTLRPVARHIYETMQALTYTPLSVRVQAVEGFLPRAGSRLYLRDAYGRPLLLPIMRATLAGQALTLEATGNPRRDSVTAVNSRRYTDLQGKMLEIRADIDGLNVKASELQGNFTELDLSVEGLTARTEDLQGDYTQLQQDVDGLDLTVVKKGEVRTQFAADADSVTIQSGLVAFTANTLSVDSTNFRLTREGNVTANGTFNSQSGALRSSVLNGGFFSYNNEQICSAIYGYTESGQDMGSMRLYGVTNSGGRSNFAVVRAMTDGGAIALYGPDDDLQLQVTHGQIQARSLGVSGEKNRLVQTGYGTLKLHTVESPQPRFADFGAGACDGTGCCLLVPDPRFAETVSARQPLLWQVTPTAPGALWVEPGPPAVVHGAPGQTFHWMVSAPQRDYEDQYLERWDALTVPEAAAAAPAPLPDAAADPAETALWGDWSAARQAEDDNQWQLLEVSV